MLLDKKIIGRKDIGLKDVDEVTLDEVMSDEKSVHGEEYNYGSFNNKEINIFT